ncbi:MAG TPA: response regulator [Roseiflexaceae bacterium]|nr:response regulator [Roseiflexaceae bacterium]
MKRVLIVDDTLFIRRRLARLLADHGYDTVEAEDGDQALDMYRRATPDLVLMDLTMPNRDGLEALDAIRREDPRARVIMLTALGQEPIVQRALEAGASDFLIKPAEPERLLRALERALETA